MNNTSLEVLHILADGETPMSKYGHQKSIDYLIGYGAGKCLAPKFIAELIKNCAEAVDMSIPENVLDWIIERESD